MSTLLTLVECPRDAMQGIHDFIPTDLKIRYLNALLRCGFEVLDFGSFVSPQAIPQLRDTHEVVQALDLSGTQTKLLAIVANRRGAEEAMQYPQIAMIGYPFSVSETFQQRNTKRGIAESLELVREMQEMCAAAGKELVVYLSMAFGNPYGDAWSPALVTSWAEKIAALGVKTIALADTIGVANPQIITQLFTELIPRLPEVTIGAHFHSTPDTRLEKLSAAWDAGCRRFDSALSGFGGCPFAADELVGNMATEDLLQFAHHLGAGKEIDSVLLQQAQLLAQEVFGGRH